MRNIVKSQTRRFKKTIYRVRNWSAYNAGLKNRGDITVWLSDDVIQNWKPNKNGNRGRPLCYSDSAIESFIMLRLLYGLPLRQTEGLLNSVLKLMGLKIKSPDYSSVSRRMCGLKRQGLTQNITPGSHVLVDSTGLKIYGLDEWHQQKHKVKSRKTWRKLHIAVDENHNIIASDLTDNSVGDCRALNDILDQLDKFETFMADGAYDGKAVYDSITKHSPNADIVIPPPINAVEKSSIHHLRDESTQIINNRGRGYWEKIRNYGKRSHVEMAMLRYKKIIGPKLKSRKFKNQKIEAYIATKVINVCSSIIMPNSEKVA